MRRLGEPNFFPTILEKRFVPFSTIVWVLLLVGLLQYFSYPNLIQTGPIYANIYGAI